MTGAQLSTVHSFEGEVKPGDEVRVGWSEIFQSMLGVVDRVLSSHIDVTITDGQGADYMVGQTMRFPMVNHHSVWSWHNRVEPLCGYFHPEPLEYAALARFADMPFSAHEEGVRLVA